MHVDKDRLELTTAMIIYGTIGLVRRYIPYSSAMVACMRAIIGVIFLLIVHTIRRRRFDIAAIKRHIIPLCISGAMIGIDWVILFEAYRYTTISVATICYYMAPVFIILASPFLFHEKITLKKGICAAVSLMGMVMVSGVIETGFSGIKGALLGLASAVIYAIAVMLNKKIEKVSTDDRTVFQLGLAAIVLLPYVLMTEDVSNIPIDGFIICMVLISGIVHTGIAYTMYFESIRRVPAQTVAILSYIDPIVAVIISALILREGITPIAVVGVVMVIGAAIISERR